MGRKCRKPQLPVVSQHVDGVVDEVTYRKGHESVRGRSKGSNQVIAHLWVLEIGP